MGFLDNKFVAKFINGGAPPKSFTKQIGDRPPPDYEKYPTTQQIVTDKRLQRSMIYLNLPTRREREVLESEERERREKDPQKKVKRKGGSRMSFAGRAGVFGGIGG